MADLQDVELDDLMIASDGFELTCKDVETLKGDNNWVFSTVIGGAEATVTILESDLKQVVHEWELRKEV